MRTEKRRVNLAEASEKYNEQQQTQQQQKPVHKTGNKAPAPIVGTIIGMLGTGGTIAANIGNVPLPFVLMLSIVGCIGALTCRGNNGDYESLSARICVGSALISLVTGIIILTIYLQSLGIWDFAMQ